jgi:hypothetical protein
MSDSGGLIADVVFKDLDVVFKDLDELFLASRYCGR